MVPTKLPPPTNCAVLTMELQRGVVGDLATMPQLAEACAKTGVLEACGDLVGNARAHEVPVIHCVVSWRADRAGTSLNSPLSAALSRNPGQILEGTEAVELVAELGDTSGELRSARHHGLTPFTGTDLDPLLRSLGVEHVVVCGVSLNVGVLGLCLSAVDLGYYVTVCTDAVVGVPVRYGEDVIKNTMAMLATLTTTTELTDHWRTRTDSGD